MGDTGRSAAQERVVDRPPDGGRPGGRNSPRPVLPPYWSVYAVGSDEIELRSVGRSVRLSGPGGDALADVLDVVDGGRPVNETSAPRPSHDAAKVDRLITQLAAHGLVVNDDTVARCTERPGSRLEEFLQAVGGSHNLGAMRERLAHARLAVCGSDEISCAIVDSLSACQIDVAPMCLSPASTDDEIERLGGATLVIGTGTDLRDQGLDQLNAASLALGVPWLPVIADAVELSVGPLVLPGISACLACLRIRSEALMPAAARLVRIGSRPLLPAMVAVTAGLVAVEALRFVLAWDHSSLVDRLIRMRFRTMEWTTTDVLRLPHCPVCGAGRRWERASVR